MKICTIFQNKIVKSIIAVVFWIGMWALAANYVGKELIVPKPTTVFKALIELFTRVEAWGMIGRSVIRVLVGFVIGCGLGIIMAIMTKVSLICDTIFSPFIGVVRTVPVSSFIILALLWIKSDYLPVFIVFLIVLPIVWGNVREGIEQTNGKLLEMSNAFKTGKLKTVRYVYVPSIKPYFKSAAITGLGIGWKSGVAAEVLSQPGKAIGTQLYYSKIYLETADLFAWTLVIIIISILVETMIKKLLNRI